MLYIVSTPIGHLKDITLRAIETLKSVDLIAAEDTRHTKILCNEYGIATPLTSYFEHNERSKSEYLAKLLKEGKNIALVTDAGTPGISDPGYRVVKAAKDEGIPITVIPGATAMIAALSLSALPTDRFVFEGFLPPKEGGREKRLEALKAEERTIIFYESPHRVEKTLRSIAKVLNNPVVTCAREITKKFEEVKEGPALSLAEEFTKKDPRGEFVIVLNLKKV